MKQDPQLRMRDRGIGGLRRNVECDSHIRDEENEYMKEG